MLQAAPRNYGPPGASLSGHAGFRVHDSGKSFVHAANTQWETYGESRSEDRGRHGKGRPITPEEAVMRVEPLQLDQLLHPILDPKAKTKELAQGLPASPGAVSGRIVFSAEDAVAQAKQGRVVLVRKETVPDDIHGMEVAVGILT